MVCASILDSPVCFFVVPARAGIHGGPTLQKAHLPETIGINQSHWVLVKAGALEDEHRGIVGAGFQPASARCNGGCPGIED